MRLQNTENMANLPPFHGKGKSFSTSGGIASLTPKQRLCPWILLGGTSAPDLRFTLAVTMEPDKL